MKLVRLVTAGLSVFLLGAPAAEGYSGADRAIVSDFARHHGAGYKVLAVARSDFTSFVGVWYVRTGAVHGYAAAGVAFYNHGRHARPNNDAVAFLTPAPRYVASFSGSATYSSTDSATNPDDGTSQRQAWSAQFRWRAGYGSRREPIVMGSRESEVSAESNGFSVSGSVSYEATSTNGSPDDGSCTGTLRQQAGADPSQFAASAGRRGWSFSFDLVDTATSSPDFRCSDITPQDPNPDNGGTITLSGRYAYGPAQARGVDAGNLIWSPFTVVPSVHHHRRSPSADTGGTVEEDIAASGIARFDLIGLGTD